MLKKAWKIVLAVVLALLVVVLGYVAYVFIDYHRIGNQELTVERNAAATVEAGKEYGILSYNIGFGAYEDDYSFFMDGGTESRAWSEERLTANIERIGAFLQQQDADLYLLQEVDRDSTRSYHVDEVAMLTAQLPGLGYIWAQNYDSPYLFYPLDQPHGKSVSGLLTLSSFWMGQNMVGTLAAGQTMAFITLSISQLVQSYNMRSERSLFHIGPFSNKKLNQACLASLALVLLVLFTPLRIAFGLAALPAKMYLIAFGISFIPLLVMEFSKKFGLIKHQH